MRVAFTLLTLVTSLLIVVATAAGAPNATKSLAGKSVPIDERGCCIASDGGVWAPRGDFGLERFDGEAWHDTNTFKRGGQLAVDTDVKFRLTSYSLVPGQNGWVLTYVGHRVSDLHIEGGMLLNHLFYPTFLLLNGQTGGGAPNFELWMASSRERFLEAFSQPSPNRAWYTWNAKLARKDSSGQVTIGPKELIRPCVVVDKTKNIWVTAGFTGAVFNKKAAIPLKIPVDGTKPPPAYVPEALLNLGGGGPEGSRRPVCVALPGNGEYVFLRLEGGDSYFLRLTPKGEVDFQKGPALAAHAREFERWPLRDQEGGLWLVVDPGLRQDRNSEWVPNPGGAIVRRVMNPDQGQDFNNMGVPRVVDAAGCVWLLPQAESGKDTATVWSPDGKTFAVKVPKRKGEDFVVAGEKGHVFIQTAGGLQEFMANNSDKPTEYAPTTLYHLEGLGNDGILDIQYSSLGYLVVVSQKLGQGFDGPCTIHLFPIGPTQSVRKVAAHTVARGSGEAEPATTATKKTPPVVARPAADLRMWQDATGQFSIKASFLHFGAGVVTLRKEDGSTIKVPMEKLIDEDQKYIRNRRR